MFNLKGRVAVVTGASAGLGTEIADGLAQQGSESGDTGKTQGTVRCTGRRIQKKKCRCTAGSL